MATQKIGSHPSFPPSRRISPKRHLQQPHRHTFAESRRSRFYRNRRIGEFLKELDLAEGRNTGIGKIVRAMRENGSPDPQFYNPETRSFMTVILPIHEAFKVNETAAEAETVLKARAGTENLPENLPEDLTVTAKKIYNLLREDGKYTYDRLANAVGVTRETVRVSIRSLVEAHLVRRVGPDKGGHWEVVKG